ncbi:MAG TPA: cytochrome P450, partial [Actinomycetota bacterium]|nr:cytochrome P450 [Actinomycetota bacterium]
MRETTSEHPETHEEPDERTLELARTFGHHDESLDVAFDVYRELRERCPIGRSDRYGGFWFAVRYDDIHAIEQQPETFAVSPGMLLPPMGHVRPGIPIDIDPPMHGKYRRITLPAFTPQRIAEMEPMVRGIARDLLDEIGDVDEVDASKRFAVPMPMRVFCAVAGLPAEDSERLEDWIDRIFYVRTHDYADTERAAAECCAYLAERFEARRREPPRDDLLGRLLTAEVDGRPLSEEELVDYGFVLLTAGLDTTAWVIRSGLWHLAQHPDDLARLVEQPELIPTAVEEFLRCLSSVQAMARTATEDVPLDGHQVAEGDRVLIVFGAGNRDEAVFPDGDRIRIDRQPNPHMAFGVGIHRCLGSNLARRELRIAFEEFLARHRVFALAPGADPPWHGI